MKATTHKRLSLRIWKCLAHWDWVVPKEPPFVLKAFLLILYVRNIALLKPLSYSLFPRNFWAISSEPILISWTILNIRIASLAFSSCLYFLGIFLGQLPFLLKIASRIITINPKWLLNLLHEPF